MTTPDSTTGRRLVAFSEQFLDAAPDAILVVDADGVMRVANRKATELFGYEVDELVGQSVDVLVPDHRRGDHEGRRHDYWAQPRIRQMGDARSKVAAQRRDGSTVPVEIALSPVSVDGLQYVMAIVRDVTDRLDAELEQSSMRLRLAVVEDRDRIARDLHDLVIQRLFATGMRLQSALGNPDQLLERATLAIADLDETIAVIRDSIFHLTHTQDDLSTQVRDLIRRHDASMQCEVAIEVEGELDSLPPSLGEHLLPTLNEALANVVRHARASAVTISLRVGHTLQLRVIDDGVGLDPEAPPGFGLANLQQRAAQLGGELRVTRIADGGTDLLWQVPLTR